MTRCFFDTNILLYALETNAKAHIARRLLDQGGLVSIQCLNEFANVAVRKLGLSWSDVNQLLDETRRRCGPVVPLDDAVHLLGLRLAEERQLSIYDGLIVAAALHVGCTTLYSEDMHDGLVIDRRLTIINPFRA